jgi:GDP-L-fucose synthase
MKLLVTGANGFLGKHVCKELNKTNIDYLAPTSSELDILNRTQLLEYMEQYQPDTILHGAAKCGGLLANKNSPADYMHTNIDMASNIFHAAKQYQVARVYSLGSVCAYPKYCQTPFREDDIWQGYPEETNAPYGQAKRTLMLLGQSYRQQYGIGGAHFIPVNMYGEHDKFDLTNSHVIPALIRKITEAADTLYCWGSDNGTTREFLYAGDCAKAIVKAISSGFDNNLPINLGTGQDISIRDLAHLIARLMDFRGSIIFTGEVGNGQPKRLLDVSRAKQLLGWTASTSLEDGLRKTIEWYCSSQPE